MGYDSGSQCQLLCSEEESHIEALENWQHSPNIHIVCHVRSFSTNLLQDCTRCAIHIAVVIQLNLFDFKREIRFHRPETLAVFNMIPKKTRKVQKE